VKPRAVLGVAFGVLTLGLVGGVMYAVFAPKKAKVTKPGVAPIVPGVNPNVNYNQPAISVQVGTGYQDVRFQDVVIDTTHLDGYFQYQGGVR
jgi:hypothetical protein